MWIFPSNENYQEKKSETEKVDELCAGTQEENVDDDNEIENEGSDKEKSPKSGTSTIRRRKTRNSKKNKKRRKSKNYF